MASFRLLPVAAEPLRAVASQLRDECSSFDRLMNDVFADVEQLRDQLQLKMAEVDDARERLAERGRQLAEQRQESGRLSHQLEHHEARLDAALEELRQLRTQSELERVASAEREQLLRRISELESRQNVPLAGIESGTSPNQLNELQLQLELLRQEQRTLEKSHAEVLRERDRLESELELVRSRACELQEVVAEQQDRLSQQQDDVSDELRQLKSVIEIQLSTLHRKSQPIERPPAAAPQVTAAVMNVATAQPETADVPAADPVMSSVMAQFARLQKDVAQRRKKK